MGDGDSSGRKARLKPSEACRRQACKLRDGVGAKTKFVIDSNVCDSHDPGTADWPN